MLLVQTSVGDGHKVATMVGRRRSGADVEGLLPQLAANTVAEITTRTPSRTSFLFKSLMERECGCTTLNVDSVALLLFEDRNQPAALSLGLCQVTFLRSLKPLEA